ncbi:MAG: UDP-2,3-diacylglucosamine diphosphatase LpxI [Rhodospirillaceae bacterium]
MDDISKDKLGIIAGGGDLPNVLVGECLKQKRRFVLVALEGEANVASLSVKPDLVLRIGRAGQCFRKFREAGVCSVVMAGKVHRPSLLELRPDFRTFKFLIRTGTRAFVDKKSVGDDRLLRAVIQEIESEGFKVVGVDDVLSSLCAPPGVLGRHQPSESDYASVSIGIMAAKQLGAADIGQAVVVHSETVIDREDENGTNALIQRAGHSKKAAGGLILIKTLKPSQDRRADLPVIGPETIEHCASAGFKGIAVEAQGTLILDRGNTVAAANAAGLFFIAVECDPTTHQASC